MLHGLWMAAWHGLWMFLYKMLGWEALNAAVVILTCASIHSSLRVSLCVYVARMFVVGRSLKQSLIHLQPTRSSSESICSRPGSSIPGSPGHAIYVSCPCQHHLSLPKPITIHAQTESMAAWDCTKCSFAFFLYFSRNIYIKDLISSILLIVNIHAYIQNKYKYCLREL